MSLPVKRIAKLCTHQLSIRVNGIRQVSVMMAACDDLISYEILAGYDKIVEFGINMLKSVKHCDVVGLVVKDTGPNTPTLLLSVETFCLVIKLDRLKSYCKSLTEFLLDPNICFVGDVHMLDDLSKLGKYGFETKNSIPVVELIKVVHKTWPSSFELSDHAAMVGISLEVPPKGDFKLDAPGFSDKEIRCLIHEVHSAFLIGRRLLETVFEGKIA